MFRYLLITHTLLLSLAGPNACCCIGTRVVLGATSWLWTGVDTNLQSFECCRHTVRTAADNRSDGGQSGSHLSDSQSPTDHCRCSKNLSKGVPSQSVEVVAERSRSCLDEVALSQDVQLIYGIAGLSTDAVRPDETPPQVQLGREIRVRLHSWQI